MPNAPVAAAATGLPKTTPTEMHRRSFLRGALPAAAAIAAPATVQAATSPQERARRAWAEFTAAMRELTADADGWTIAAGERRGDGAWLNLRSVQLARDGRCPRLTVEGHHALML